MENTQNRALPSQCYYYCYYHGCYCYLAFSNRHLRRLGIPADWPLQGPGFSWNLLLFQHMTFAPVLGSSWGGKGGCSAQLLQACVFRFAAESIFTLSYYNQILLSRVCFPFLLIFVYKTRGSYQSPQPMPGLLSGTAQFSCPSLQ